MQDDLKLSSYHYHLPENLIAQHPAEKRDNSRLMLLHKDSGEVEHHHFSSVVDHIGERDMLVVNNTRVFPARLFGNKETGGKAELFLLEFPVVVSEKEGKARGCALIKASKRPKPGSLIRVNDHLNCRVIRLLEGGKTELEIIFDTGLGLNECLNQAGQVPLPPYIHRKDGSSAEDRKRYQTVYADRPGAVAAPTAGLHFTTELLEAIGNKGTLVSEVTLHVGYGTFAPVRDQDIRCHRIHSEFLSIPQDTVDKVAKTKERGGKIWAVGTTSVRALEYGARKTGQLEATEGWCDLYIYPGYRFAVVDNLITNFHLPDSSLMFLVSALCGRQTLLDCYATAVREGYRFFSYGDAMAIIGGQKSGCNSFFS